LNTLRIIQVIIILFVFGCRQNIQNQISNNDIEIALLKIDDSVNRSIESGNQFAIQYDSLLKICNTSGLFYARANILRRYGIYYLNKGLMDSSISKGYQSLKYTDTSGIYANDTDRINRIDSYYSTYNNIGEVYHYFKVYDSALVYYQKSYNYFKRTKYALPQVEISKNISDVMIAKGDLKSAFEFALKSLIAIRQTTITYPKFATDSIACWKQILRATPNKTVEIVNQACKQILISTRSENNFQRKCENYAFLVCQFRKLKKPVDGYIDSTNKYLSFVLDFGSKKIVYEYLSEYYSIAGPIDSFVKYLKQVKQLEDSVLGKEKFRIITNTSELYKKLTNQENALLKASNSRKTWINITSVSAIFVFLIVGFFIYRNYRQKQELALKELKLKQVQVNDLLQQQELSIVNAALEGQEKERLRIAVELHDGIGSSLSLAKLHFSEMEEELIRLQTKNTERYFAFSELLGKTMDDVRRLSHDLYGSTLMKLGLQVAVQQLADAVQQGKHITVKLHVLQVPVLTYQKEIHIYRIIQELLSNSLKYADATRIDIQLLGDKNTLQLQFEENGRGFDFEKSKSVGGIGLRSIESRMKQLGGTWVLESNLGKGMQFFATIPCDTKSEI